MTKSHFNYLLLDPRHLQPPHSMGGELVKFRNFVEAIFYVGKGKNSRSLQHLKDAKEYLRGNMRRKVRVAHSLRANTFLFSLEVLLSSRDSRPSCPFVLPQ